MSGQGYYRNAHDHGSIQDLLLGPAGPTGSGEVVVCAHDPLTGVDHRGIVVEAPPDAVLVVDTVFAFRSERDPLWDYRIWLEVDAAQSLLRGVARNASREGDEEATRLHRDRYGIAEELYLAEVAPIARADVVIDNSDWASPHILRWASHGSTNER